MEIRVYQDNDLYEADFDQRENYKHQIEYDPKSILVATENDRY